jgi:hypothetical protein
MFANKVGRGRVLYSTDVLEMHAPARSTGLGQMVYKSFLQWAGTKRPPGGPDSPWVHFFRSRTSQNDELYTLINRDETAPAREIRFTTRSGPVRIDVARRMTGALAVTASGAIQSIETTGRVEAGGAEYCDAGIHMMLFSLDRKDLKKSEILCLLPMGEGRVRLRTDVIAGSARFQVGEFQKAKWVPLEQGQVAVRGGWIELDVSRDRNLSIVLIAPADRMEEGAKRLSELLFISS